MKPDLENLVNVRSIKAEAVIAYLKGLREMPNRDVPPYMGERRQTDHYIYPEVMVQEKRAFWRGWVIKGEQLNGRNTEEDKQRKDWNKEYKEVKKAVIVGPVCAGKTLLCRMTARDIAIRSLSDLEDWKKSVEDVDIPIYVDVFDIVEKDSIEEVVERTVRDNMRAGFEKNYPNAPEPFIEIGVRHIKDMLYTEQCWWFLDGLDAMNRLNKSWGKNLRNLINKTKECHVVTTYRNDSDRTASPPFCEYKLLPFKLTQKIEFVSKWFPLDSNLWKKTINQLDEDPYKRLTCNAKMLTLLCAANEGDLPRIELYHFILHEIASKVMQVLPLSKLVKQEIISLLYRVAWVLFYDKMLSPFTYSELKCAIGVSTSFKPEDQGDIIEILRNIGLIVSTYKESYEFFDNHFMKYLVACYIWENLKNCSNLLEEKINDKRWLEVFDLVLDMRSK